MTKRNGTRRLGTQGLDSFALGYGAMGTVFGYGPSDDTESIAAIRRAHEDGVTHFDTAEMYGWGEGERLLGEALRPIREEVTIATKFGFEKTFKPNSRPEHIREVVDGSLQRLSVDSIDLLYQHTHDPEVPVEDVTGVMKEFIDAGKVKYLGLSNTTVDNVRRANAVHPISALQMEYSIFARGVEDYFPVLEELGIGLVAYSPIARGFLSGAVRPRDGYAADDWRQQNAWWAPDHYPTNVALSERLGRVAASKGISLSQLALAWLLEQKPYIVPIPGSRSPERVSANNAATQIELSSDDLAAIAAIMDNGPAQ
jgi:aryl-alcohol dehydrogenase-like predicted oxidoreductase